MKRVCILLAALVLAAGCSDSRHGTGGRRQPGAIHRHASDRQRSAGDAERRRSGAPGMAHIDFNLTKDAAGAITAATVRFPGRSHRIPGDVGDYARRTFTPAAAGVSGAVLINTGVTLARSP